MGRMKEIAMMLEYDDEHLQMCEKQDLIDLITLLKHELSIAIDDGYNEAREDYFAMASAEVASAEEEHLDE